MPVEIEKEEKQVLENKHKLRKIKEHNILNNMIWQKREKIREIRKKKNGIKER